MDEDGASLPSRVVDLSVPLDECDLPRGRARVVNAILNARYRWPEVTTLYDLTQLRRSDLMMMKNIGRKTVSIIEAWLADWGLMLRPTMAQAELEAKLGTQRRPRVAIDADRSKRLYDRGRAAGWYEAADFVEVHTGKRFGKPLAKNMRDHAKELAPAGSREKEWKP